MDGGPRSCVMMDCGWPDALMGPGFKQENVIKSRYPGGHHGPYSNSLSPLYDNSSPLGLCGGGSCAAPPSCAAVPSPHYRPPAHRQLPPPPVSHNQQQLQQLQQQQQMQQQHGRHPEHVVNPEWINLLSSINLQQLEDTGARFQFMMGASTSPAVKIDEEPLTYLNQGQSYEIKLKRLVDHTDEHFLKCIVRVIFHERRLQYMEREQMDHWRQIRPGERILDLDIPISYGLVDLKIDSQNLNVVEFMWDPQRETGVYIKVNCISTEFTPRKHGGEKGVPFRIQVETYSTAAPGGYGRPGSVGGMGGAGGAGCGVQNQLIYCASCQIKVFKPKGADRKHKTDREKLDKLSAADRDKYQQSFEYSVFNEIPMEQVNQYLDQLRRQQQQYELDLLSGAAQGGSLLPRGFKEERHGDDKPPYPRRSSCRNEDAPLLSCAGGDRMLGQPLGGAGGYLKEMGSPSYGGGYFKSEGRGGREERGYSKDERRLSMTDISLCRPDSGLHLVDSSSRSSESTSPLSSSGAHGYSHVGSSKKCFVTSQPCSPQLSELSPVEAGRGLDSGATMDQVTDWLNAHRFSSYVKLFHCFAGADLLRLSRDELIQLCGLCDGIRLNNTMHAKNVRPKLTIYVQHEINAWQQCSEPSADPKLSDSSSGYWSPTASIGSVPSPPHSSTVGALAQISGQSLVGPSLGIQPLAGLPLGPLSPPQCHAGGWDLLGGTKRQQGGEGGEANEGEEGRAKKMRTNSGEVFVLPRVFHAVYLDQPVRAQLICKLAVLLGLQQQQVLNLRIEKQHGVHIHVSDAVVENLSDQSKYAVEYSEDVAMAGRYSIVLKPLEEIST